MTFRRRGLSLLEVVCVISIIVVLLGLLLPAVNSARETARRISCQNNVRQIALATTNYHSAHRILPPRRYSFSDLLPYLEENIQRKSTPEVYVCPSDEILDRSLGEISYRMNEGFAFQLYGENGIVSHPYKQGWISYKDIADGLSNTALLSEKLVVRWAESSVEARSKPMRYFFKRSLSRNPESLSGFNQLVDQSRNADDSGFPNFSWGETTNLRQEFGYNHNLPPGWISWHFPNSSGALIEPRNSFVSATSNHFATVNFAYADASVHTVTNQVDRRIWGNIGTRNGSESDHELD